MRIICEGGVHRELEGGKERGDEGKGKERQGEGQSVRLASGEGTHHARWTNIPRRTMIVTPVILVPSSS